MREAEYRASGASADDARYAARRRFGNVTHLKERTRDMWTFPSFESVRQDVRYALRTLRRSPAFTGVAIVVLALGIAGNTAMFSLVDAVRLRALPYAESDRLVILWGNVMRAKVERRGASYPDFLDWRAQASSFEGMAAGDETRMTLLGANEASRILVETVSAAYSRWSRRSSRACRARRRRRRWTRSRGASNGRIPIRTKSAASQCARSTRRCSATSVRHCAR